MEIRRKMTKAIEACPSEVVTSFKFGGGKVYVTEGSPERAARLINGILYFIC